MAVAKKQPPRKPSLDAGAALLRQRFGGRLAPPLNGFAYRFTIWLPVQAKGRPVFLPEHRSIVCDLLNQCFGGYSQSHVEVAPPWSGSWLPEEADEPIVDFHIQMVVYTLQDADSVACLRHLKWLLEQDHVAAQQVVLIEQVPVQFVAAAMLA